MGGWGGKVRVVLTLVPLLLLMANIFWVGDIGTSSHMANDPTHICDRTAVCFFVGDYLSDMIYHKTSLMPPISLFFPRILFLY